MLTVSPILAVLNALRRRVASLLHSKQRFRAIVDAINDAVFIHDLESLQVVDVNARACALFGQPVAQLRGMTLEQLAAVAAPDSRAGVSARVRAARDGEPQCFEWLLHRSDGSLVWVETVARRTRVAERERLVLVVRDITDIKRSAAVARASQEVFLTIVEASPLAIAVAEGVERRLIHVNGRFTELFGWTLDDIPPVADWWPNANPDEAHQAVIQGLEPPVEQAIRNRSAFGPSTRNITCKDGNRKVVKWGFASVGDRNVAFGEDVTEQTRAEEALKASETSYRDEFAKNASVMLLVDPEDGSIIDANAAALEFYGYSRERMLAMRVSDIHSVPAPEIRKTLESVPEKTGGLFQFRHRLADGSVRDVEVSSSRIQFGARVTLHEIIHDVTQQKRAEEDLQASRANLTALIESTNDMIWSVDRQGGVVTFNTVFAEFVHRHYGTEVVVGSTAEDLLTPKRAALWPPLYQRCLQEGPLRTEYRVAGDRIFEFSFNPILQAGEATGVSVFGKDITEQRRTQEALKQSEESFRDLFAKNSSVMWLVDPEDGSIIDANAAAIEFYGYPRERMLAMRVSDVSTVSAPEIRKTMESVREAVGMRFESRHRLADGSVRNVAVSSSRIHSGGRFILHSIIHDITERKRAETALWESETKFRTLFDLVPFTMAVHNSDGRLSDCNAILLKRIGVPREEISGHRMSDFSFLNYTGNPSDTVPDRQILQDALRGPVELHVFHRGSGRHRIVLLSAATVPLGARQDILTCGVDITDLKQSEKRYRSLFEHAPVGIFYSTLDGKIIRVNDEFARILAYASPEEAKEIVNQSTIAESVFVLSGERSRLVEQAVANPGQWIRSEQCFRRKDGSHIAANVMVRAVPENPGHLEGFVEDVTERKRSEEERERAFATLQASLEQSPSGIVIADAPNATIRWANPATFGILADATEPVIGVDLSEIAVNAQFFRKDGSPYPPEERPLARAVFRGETTRSEEVIIRNARGEDRWFSYNAAPIRNSQGAIVSGIVIINDITEGKRAEAVLRESETKFRTLFDLVPHPMTVRDLDGRLLDGNAKYREVCGLSHEEIAGHFGDDFFDLNYGGSSGEPITMGSALLRKALLGPIELVAKNHANGKRITVLFSTAIIALEDKPCFLTISVDITELRQVEQQFRQTQKMESMGRLAGGVAHDFNNLLTVIGGYTQLALAEVSKETQIYRSLIEVSKAAERAASLTRQLLAFSRNQALAPAVVDLNALILDAAKMLRRLIGEEVELDSNLSEGLPSVRVDPGQTVQVLMNLAVNARDAMPDGGRLAIATAIVEVGEERAGALNLRPGTHVCLRVKDTGTGMDEETQARIFEPFFTTKPVGQGTGLGLSTVFGIVKQSGGSIMVSSQPGAGTVFEILLPAVAPAESMRERPRSEAVAAGTETVLLVEDDDAIRKLSMQVLGRAGYVLLEAANGTDALTVARSLGGPIDLLLTDLKMPGISGLEVARRLREEFPDMAVLYMSGYSSGGTLNGAQADVQAELIWKPFSPAVLLKHVRRALDARHPTK
jgi:PAS domain S-box-containing protein